MQFYKLKIFKFKKNLLNQILLVDVESKYSFVCQTVDYSTDPLAIRVIIKIKNYSLFNLNLNPLSNIDGVCIMGLFYSQDC